MPVELTKPTNVKDRLALAHQRFEEAKEVLSVLDVTPEVEERATALIDEAKRLQKTALQMEEIEKQAASLQLDIDAKGGSASPLPSSNKGNRQWKYWGEFLEAVHATNKGKDDPRLVFMEDDPGEKQNRRSESKDMTGATGAQGGFLIPGEFVDELYAAMNENAIVRPRATVIPMRRRSIQIPVLDQTQTTAGRPHWFGGMVFFWADEAEEMEATEPKFRMIELTAKKLIGYTRSSDELLDDAAISLEAFLRGPLGFAGGATFMEDWSFLNGSGAGTPLGILNPNCAATISQSRTGGGGIVYDDLVNMLERFMPSANGVWIANQSTMSNLLLMNGPSGNPSYLWGSAVSGAPATLLGRPIIFTEKSPVVGAAGDIALADFKYYLIADRQSPTVDSSNAPHFRTAQTAWRMIHRIDGQPWLSAPLTLMDGSTQISPFVKLAA